jgi:hypothetical protein
MSTSAFQTMAEEIARQRYAKAHYGRSNSEPSLTLTPDALHSAERRTLYGTLPFVAVPGMQHRESHLRKVLSRLSLSTLGDAGTPELDTVDVDAVIFTFPLIMAVLVAAIAQFLVGYNTGVMNAPASVVFPGHTTLEWSFDVSAFAVGGPFGAILGEYHAVSTFTMSLPIQIDADNTTKINVFYLVRCCFVAYRQVARWQISAGAGERCLSTLGSSSSGVC